MQSAEGRFHMNVLGPARRITSGRVSAESCAQLPTHQWQCWHVVRVLEAAARIGKQRRGPVTQRGMLLGKPALASVHAQKHAGCCTTKLHHLNRTRLWAVPATVRSQQRSSTLLLTHAASSNACSMLQHDPQWLALSCSKVLPQGTSKRWLANHAGWSMFA